MCSPCQWSLIFLSRTICTSLYKKIVLAIVAFKNLGFWKCKVLSTLASNGIFLQFWWKIRLFSVKYQENTRFIKAFIQFFKLLFEILAYKFLILSWWVSQPDMGDGKLERHVVRVSKWGQLSFQEGPRPIYAFLNWFWKIIISAARNIFRNEKYWS